MRFFAAPLVVSAFLLQAGTAQAQVGQYPFALTREGQLLGAVEAGVASFKGIPYAAAPVGALRWAPPQPAPESSEIRAMQQYGPACPQPWMSGPGSYRTSEDCLTLNIFKRADIDAPLPVMVWIHGGSFVAGTAGDPLFDGAKLAREGVIVVTLNYRLGAFGWLAPPASVAGPADRRTANFGLMDQIAALRWVHDNIAAFGGDPDNVTLFGVSSGALSVALLMLCDSSRGLFQKAILQSVPGREPLRSMATTDDAGRRLFQAVARGGTGLDPRTADAAVVLAAEEQLLAKSTRSFAPTLDGTLVQENIASAFEAGRESHVPLIIGSEDETGFTTESDVGEELGRAGDAIEELRRLYPEASGNPKEVAARLHADRVFTEPARFLARSHAATGAPTFRYRFSNAAERAGGDGDHESEPRFVFGVEGVPGAGVFTDQQREVSHLLRAYWTNFAKTGNPNGSGLPLWEDGAARERLLLISNAGTSSGDDPWSERLDRLERRSQ